MWSMIFLLACGENKEDDSFTTARSGAEFGARVRSRCRSIVMGSSVMRL